jgi:putative glycosyltransferase (TIGR04372 family)
VRRGFGLLWAAIWLLRNRGVLKQKTIYLMWQQSFGHAILGLDMGARMWHPARASLIYLVDANSIRKNSLLPKCFEESFVIHVIDLHGTRGSIENRYRGLRAVLRLSTWLRRDSQLCEHAPLLSRMDLYLKKSESKIRYFDHSKNQKEFYHDPGYLELLHSGKGVRPKLSKEILKQFHNHDMLQKVGFFDRPFITLLLRNRGAKDNSYYNHIRCSGPQENYRDAVRHFVQSGFHVVGTGETDHDVFINIEGYFSLDDVGLHPELTNLFALTECELFVGQHSGPFYLSSSCSIPVLLCDVMPYWQASVRKDDLLVYKRVYAKLGGYLSPWEVFEHHADFAYGNATAGDGYEVRDALPEEILAGAKEMVQRLRSDQAQEEDIHVKEYRSMLPVDMLVGKVGNVPPLELLRAMKK